MEVKILVIENTRHLRLCEWLKESGYQVAEASREQYRQDPESYALFDLALYVCSRREEELPRFTRPTLFILEQSCLPKDIGNFRMGREDYIAEPVNPAELLSRVEMLLRCSGIDVKQKLALHTLQIDGIAREVTVNGEIVPLTTREFNLLHGMLSFPNKTFSRKELLGRYWGKDTTTSKRAVDVYMTKLREKFSECADFQIVTVHGIGYKAVLK